MSQLRLESLSNVSKALFELSPLFKKKVIMTGTPVANRPYDIWSQIYFLDEGKVLGKSFKEFKADFDLTSEIIENNKRKALLEEQMSALFNKISKFTARITKQSHVIKLPEKEYETIVASWEPRQYDLYRQVQESMRAIIIKGGIPSEDKSEDVIKRLLRLVQIASNPKLIDDSYNVEPGKYIALSSLVSKIIYQKEKAIIWTAFTQNVDEMAEFLKSYGTCKVHGKMGIEDRNNSIEKFLREEGCKILVATPGAAKEGLTLTVANNVIFYDRSFSLDDYLQAQDRIHRISQIKTCHIYNLIMEDSIDQWVDALISAKELAAKLTQGDITLEAYRKKASYSFTELLKNILNI